MNALPTLNTFPTSPSTLIYYPSLFDRVLPRISPPIFQVVKTQATSSSSMEDTKWSRGDVLSLLQLLTMLILPPFTGLLLWIYHVLLGMCLLAPWPVVALACRGVRGRGEEKSFAALQYHLVY